MAEEQMMPDYLIKVYMWFSDNVIAVVHNTHAVFWNGNTILFVAYIIGLTILIDSRNKPAKGRKLFAAFSIIVMIAFCYNPLVLMLFMKMPNSSEGVYGRLWIMLPVWLVIAFSAVDCAHRFKSVISRNSLPFVLAVGIVLVGYSINDLDYYYDSNSIYKANPIGIEIADAVLSDSNYDNTGLLLFGLTGSSSFSDRNSAYYAIEQYTGKISVCPVYQEEQMWNDYYISEYLPDGETITSEYINNTLIKYRRVFDFSYVAMPQDESLKDKLEYSGYQYVASVNNYDIYAAMQQWCVQSYAGYMENGKKVYVVSDNMGHFIVIDGGCKSDRRQLQQILQMCGNHVDAWIMTNPSASNLEGFNSIVATEGFIVDSVYLPAINIETVPSAFMDEKDYAAYERLLVLANEGLFTLDYWYEGDEVQLYGMNIKVFSDMTDVKYGSAIENSMLFRAEINDSSFLFCSYMGYEQGQLALQKYGDTLDSDYVQIASGYGDGLGPEFYAAVSPEIAFCDSLRDDAGRQTYDMLIGAGITCYCIDNGDMGLVLIK